MRFSPWPCWPACCPLTAQAQDAGKALGGLFQSLTRPNQPAQPAQAQPNSAAGLAGALLGASLSPGGQQAAQGGDLFKLLSQSLDQIDEPREIQIGQQLAAVLLGSKPLYPDMAMQRYINQLGRWISLQSSRPDLPWTFRHPRRSRLQCLCHPGRLCVRHQGPDGPRGRRRRAGRHPGP
jgi:hypothetical protein